MAIAVTNQRDMYSRASMASTVQSWWRVLLGVMALMFSLSVTAESGFQNAVQALNAKNFSAKGGAIKALVELGDPRSKAVLEAMLNGKLFYRKSDKKVVIAEKTENGYQITDPLDGNEIGDVGRREVKKIGVNNRLRSQLRAALALLNLRNPDADIRLTSIKAMYGSIDAAGAGLLTKIIEQDSDKRVVQAAQTAIALYELKNGGTEEKVAAIERLSGNLEQVVRNELAEIVEADSSAVDSKVRNAAESALQVINGKLQFNSLVETTFFGLSLGSVLLLAAIGLAITFGVMGVINMAHGELIMLGAYTTYLVQQAMPEHIDISLFVAIPAAFLVSGLFGVAMERGIIRHLYGRPLETLLATFGISLVLQQLVRTTISAQNVAVANPSWMSGSFDVNAALSLTNNRLYIIIFALAVFLLLLLILKKTALGLQVRAVAQNRPMAKAMGIRSDWVDAMTFGLGAGIAGVAGVALSQLTNVGPNMGQSYIIDSFMVVVFGGVGNLWGTLVGALSLGIANKYLEPWSGAVLAKIFVLVFIILFIQKRPRGLFPQKGRAAEN